MKRRVVITGIGLATPLASSREATWQKVLDGVSGIVSRAFTDKDHQVTHPVGAVSDDQVYLDALLSKKEQTRTDRFTHLALIAANEALSDAGRSTWSANLAQECGVVLGVSIGGLSTISDLAQQLPEHGMKRISAYMIPKVISNECASYVSMKWGLQGPCYTVSNACSSGADAIGQAYLMIASGVTDAMVAGGTESVLSELAVGGFYNMRALARWHGDAAHASRPFDQDRCGFVIAEGAGVLVLESLDSATARGAYIYAEVSGYAATADAYHPTAIHPDGTGAIRAIKKALNSAGITREKMDYINAHGTATSMNDTSESKVIHAVYGDHTKNISVTSTKSMTGHTLGAAGGIEVALVALSLRDQVVPPTINLETQDPACDLTIPTTATPRTIEYASSHSFGFGGVNAVVILKRFAF